MKILMPVDGSPVTKQMLGYIAARDELLGPGHHYTLLTVVPQVPGYASRQLQLSVMESHYAEEAEKVFAPIRKFTEQQPWNVSFVHASGYPAEVIAEIAQSERYDLIVMGTHGRTSLGSVVLGSVANGVLARCKTPVLLVR